MLTFAGEPLLFPSAELMGWIERNQDLTELSEPSVQPRFMSARHALRSRIEPNKGLGLPVINWPIPPRPRLNTLYWPTGATRWAQGWFLATQQARDRIFARVHSSNGNSKGTLTFGDDHNEQSDDVYALDMYLLPPRPITSFGSETRLWLMPLVDVRYFWQFVHSGPLQVTTWDCLFQALGCRLGVSIQVLSGTHGACLRPDVTEFSRRHDNAAVLLDAAAASTGRRVVRRMNGSIVVEEPTFAAQTLTANLARPYRLLAGGQYGDLGGDLPDKVLVTFRKMRSGSLVADGQLHTIEKTGPKKPVRVTGYTHVIHSTMLARTNAAGAILNSEQLDDLAEKIKDDFYAWGAKRYDLTFGAIQRWDPSGFDDAVIWSFGRPLDSRTVVSRGSVVEGDAVTVAGQVVVDLLAQTRVQNLPSSVWAELNGCADPAANLSENTTTAAPSGPTTTPAPACTGRCKWVWSDADQAWNLADDNCGTTSTTTADPQVSTTTTTADPCACSTTSTTSTTSEPTTTPAPDCTCVYPDFCGAQDEDCTYTFCAQDVVAPKVSCTTSTTTTSTTTEEPTTTDQPTTTDEPTSTTADPCSTTPEPGCQDGCDWVFLPSPAGNYSWRKVADHCLTGCPCPPPEGNGDQCSTDHTDCVPTSQAPTTTSPPCSGSCTYWWVSDPGMWVLTNDGCAKHSSRPCYCVTPSEDGDECSNVTVSCQSPETSTTTTTEAPCTSSTTSTTSTTTTSTTTSACQQSCSWRGDGAGGWVIEDDPCPGTCPCNAPAFHSLDDCEVAKTRCTRETTTTTTSTTTSTTTTTTTTLEPPTTEEPPTTVEPPTTDQPTTTGEPTTSGQPTTSGEPTTPSPTTTSGPPGCPPEYQCASGCCQPPTGVCCISDVSEYCCEDEQSCCIGSAGGGTCCNPDESCCEDLFGGVTCCPNGCDENGNCVSGSSTTSEEPTTTPTP